MNSGRIRLRRRVIVFASAVPGESYHIALGYRPQPQASCGISVPCYHNNGVRGQVRRQSAGKLNPELHLTSLLGRSATSAIRRPLWLAIGATVMSVLVVGITSVVLIEGRQEAIHRATQNSANVVSAMAGEVARNLEVYDLALQAVVEGMQDPAVATLTPGMRRKVLFDRSTIAGYISGIYALDAFGAVSEEPGGRTILANFADRDYFIVHRNRPDAGLYVSAPFRSRLRNGNVSIALSRRITAESDRRFAGVAMLAIDLKYFQQMVDKLQVGPHGSAFVIQTDGTLLARNPGLPEGLLPPTLNSPSLATLLTSKSGSYVAASPMDGVERVYTFARVRGSNLIVSMSPSLQDVTAEWKRRSLIVAALVLIVTGCFTFAVWLLFLALRQRDAAQAKLLHIAGTDALTGLANRRTLDAALEELWALATRNRLTVALYFIDADNFKAYNDQHGHDAGDRALQLIAECLARYARRGSDLAARYGGEEFVLALADTDAQHAAGVAESIRSDVESESLKRASGSGSVGLRAPMTVSIGYVICDFPPGAALVELVNLADALRLADEALYASKRAGRNRVSVADAGLALRAMPHADSV